MIFIDYWPSLPSKIGYHPRTTALSPNLYPYLNQPLKINFSITTRQKLKANIFSYRVSLALSEYSFAFNFCRRVFEKSVFEVWLRHGYKFGERAVVLGRLMTLKFYQISRRSSIGFDLVCSEKLNWFKFPSYDEGENVCRVAPISFIH